MAVDEVKEDEDLEPDDMERRGISLGKAKTTKPTTTVDTTLCMALYPSAYDSSHGTLPLCAANYDQARRDRDGHDTTESASGPGMPGMARTVSSNTASLERPTGTRSATPPRRQAVATTQLGTGKRQPEE